MGLDKIQCFKPWTDFGVWDVEGNVRVCCWSHDIVGNVNEKSIEEIWNGEGYQAVRNNMSHGKYACNPHCPILHHKGFISPYFADKFIKDYSNRVYTKTWFENVQLSTEEIHQRRTILDSKPRYIKIHIDNKCNLRCIMCHLNKSDSTNAPESFLNDLENYYPYLEGLGIWGGEPFFSSKSRKFIFGFDYDKFPQCGISVVTNGNFLLNNLSNLRDVRFDWLQVSLDATNEETYNKVRINGDWQRTVDGITELVKLRNEKGQWFPITIDMVIQQENYHEIGEFVELGRILGTRVTFGNLDTTTDWLYKEPDLYLNVKKCLIRGFDIAMKYDMLSAAASLSILLDLIS